VAVMGPTGHHVGEDGARKVPFHGETATWRAWQPVLAGLERHYRRVALELARLGAWPLVRRRCRIGGVGAGISACASSVAEGFAFVSARFVVTDFMDLRKTAVQRALDVWL